MGCLRAATAACTAAFPAAALPCYGKQLARARQPAGLQSWLACYCAAERVVRCHPAMHLHGVTLLQCGQDIHMFACRCNHEQIRNFAFVHSKHDWLSLDLQIAMLCSSWTILFVPAPLGI